MFPPPESPVCPFKGLAPFEADDRDLFFGRERLVGELIARLEATTFLVLTGPSGSGKSSLLRAGLLPSLDGRRLVVRPGSRPAVELTRALGNELSVALDGLAPGERLVLAVDQLEEVFLPGVDPDERAAFFASLVDASWDPGRRAVVLLALRADFFGRLGSYVELADLVGPNHVLLAPMSPAELRRAIEGPAERVGLSVEPALVDVLVQEVSGEPGGLPLLSAALVDLWRERSGPGLTLEGYERTGGVRGAVARHAEAALRTLGDEERLVARRIVLRLVAGGDGEAWTRRRATRAELDADDPHVARVLDALIEMRLLVAGDDSVELVHEALFEQWPRLTEWLEEDVEGRRVHQHLAQSALSWDDAGRDQSDLYRGTRLGAALEWTDEAGSTDGLNRLEREFLDESRQAFVREGEGQRRTNRRLRGLLVAAVLLLLAVAAAGAVVFVERAHAQREADANFAERLGAQALTQASPDTSLLLAREGLKLDDSAATRSNLLAALLRSPGLIGVAHSLGGSGLVGSVTGDALSPNGRLLAFRNANGVVFFNAKTLRPIGHAYADEGDNISMYGMGTQPSTYGPLARPLSGLAFSPDGRTLAVGGSSFSQEGARAVTILLDARTHHARAVEGSWPNLRGTADVLFAPNGRTLVTGGIETGTASPPAETVILRRATNAQIITSSQPIPAGHLIGFVDGGRKLLVTSGPSRSLLLDARTLRRVGTLHEGGAAAVSKNGDLAAFGRADGSIVLLDPRTRSARPETMHGHAPAAIESLAFSPDGELLASTAADGSVQVWNVSTASLRQTFAGTNPAVDPVFSRDGATLYAGSADGSVLAWDVRGGRTLVRPFRLDRAAATGRGAELASTAVAVSPDGSVFATSPAPDRITIWRSRDETRLGELSGPSGVVKSVAFSHDGRLLAAVGNSPNIVVWNVQERRRVHVLRQSVPMSPRSDMWASAVAFAPNDRLVASAANNGLQVFALRTGSLVHSVPVRGPASDLAFSADGRLLAVAGPKVNGIDVWDVRRWRQMRTLVEGNQVSSLRFEPRGTTIAAGDNLGNVAVWDAVTGRNLPDAIGGQSSPILALSFDPAGGRLITTGADGEIRLWDLTTQKLIGGPLAVSDTGGSGTFFPNGKRVIAAFGSGTGVIWNVDPASWSAQACGVARRNLTRVEWHDFLPNLAYRKVCP